MKKNDIDFVERLAKLLTLILNNRPIKPHILSNQYVDMYLAIFFEWAETHNKPIPYDFFREELFKKIPSDRENRESTMREFENAWSGWVYMYKYLDQNNKLAANT